MSNASVKLSQRFKLLVLSDKPTIFQLLSVITKKSSKSTNWFKHNLATVLEN